MEKALPDSGGILRLGILNWNHKFKSRGFNSKTVTYINMKITLVLKI